MKFFFCCALLPLAGLLYCTSAAPSKDEITDLPGIPSHSPSFKQYSGYLDSIGDIHLHYWFVESQSNAKSDPVVLWLNGGPGCSSLFGLLAENGPFHVEIDGQSLYNHDYTWNKIANMLYLDSPAGVGFSYSDSGNKTSNDDQTAAETYAALKSFFTKFFEYKNNEFFITGESYAAVYITTLSVLVVADEEINFRGFAIGNGMHNFSLNHKTSLVNIAFHGLFSAKTLENLLTYCCINNNISSCNFALEEDNCQLAVLEAHTLVNKTHLNKYYMYDDCPMDSESMFIADQLHYDFRKGNKNKAIEKTEKIIKNPSVNPDCYASTSIKTWINQPSVRKSLHISKKASPHWLKCRTLDYKEMYNGTASLYQILLPKVRAMLYNGDADTLCSYLFGQYFVKSLNLEVTHPYSPWNLDGKTVGFVEVYTNLTFVSIMNSGHMVPVDKPGPALELFKNFIRNENFTIGN